MARVTAATGVAFLAAAAFVLWLAVHEGNWIVFVDGLLLLPTGVIFLLTARRDHRIGQRSPRRDPAHPMCKDYAHWAAWRERIDGLIPIAAEMGYKVRWYPDEYEGQYALWVYGVPSSPLWTNAFGAYDPATGDDLLLRLTRLILQDEA